MCLFSNKFSNVWFISKYLWIFIIKTSVYVLQKIMEYWSVLHFYKTTYKTNSIKILLLRRLKCGKIHFKKHKWFLEMQIMRIFFCSIFNFENSITFCDKILKLNTKICPYMKFGKTNCYQWVNKGFDSKHSSFYYTRKIKCKFWNGLTITQNIIYLLQKMFLGKNKTFPTMYTAFFNVRLFALFRWDFTILTSIG